MDRKRVTSTCTGTAHVTYRDAERKSHSNKKLMSESQVYTDAFCSILSKAVLLSKAALRMWSKLPLEQQQMIMPLPNSAKEIIKKSVDVRHGSAKDVDMDALTYTADYILNISGHLQGIRECQTMLRNYSGRLRKAYRAKAEEMLSSNQELIEAIEYELERSYDDVKQMEKLQFHSREGVREARENWFKFRSKVVPFLDDPVPNTSDNSIEISDESGKERGDMEASLFTRKSKRKRHRGNKTAKESGASKHVEHDVSMKLGTPF